MNKLSKLGKWIVRKPTSYAFWFFGDMLVIQFATKNELTIPSLWRCWEISIPKMKNWCRFSLMTPLFTFSVNGWLFWGKRPND